MMRGGDMVPPVANWISPGLVFASSINAGNERASNRGCAVMIIGVVSNVATGARSRTGSLAQIAEKVRVEHQVRHGGEPDRATVGLSVSERFHGDHAACARLVQHDHRSSQRAEQ